MDEESAVIGWAYGVLSGSAASALVDGRIFDSQAPQGTTGDYITIHSQSFQEVGTAIAGTLGAFMMLLTVKAITQTAGDFTRGGAIMQAAHAALQGQSGNSNGVTIQKCVRAGKVPRYPENKDGQTYQHLGNIYRVYGVYQ